MSGGLSFAVTGHRLHWGRKGLTAPHAAGLAQRQYSFHPPISLITFGPQASFPPEGGKAQHPFGMIVGGRHSLFVQEHPHTLQFLEQTPGKLPPVILVVEIPGNQVDKTGIERLPFSPVGRRMGHMTEALQLLLRPPAKPGRLLIRTLGQAFSHPDQMGPAGLSQTDVFLIHPIAIADQDALPVANQIRNG